MATTNSRANTGLCSECIERVMAVEKALPLTEVPKAVMDAVRKNYPGAKITLAEKLVSDGTLKYEFQMKQKGEDLQAVFEPGGRERRHRLIAGVAQKLYYNPPLNLRSNLVGPASSYDH